MALTGETRYRLKKTFTGYILVLQVEDKPSILFGAPIFGNTLCRDAKVEDLAELEMKGVRK